MGLARTLRRAVSVAGLVASGLFAACALNPQPLPPGDRPEGGLAVPVVGGSGSSGSTGGGSGSDATQTPGPTDGGPEAGMYAADATLDAESDAATSADAPLEATTGASEPDALSDDHE